MKSKILKFVLSMLLIFTLASNVTTISAIGGPPENDSVIDNGDVAFTTAHGGVTEMSFFNKLPNLSGKKINSVWFYYGSGDPNADLLGVADIAVGRIEIYRLNDTGDSLGEPIYFQEFSVEKSQYNSWVHVELDITLKLVDDEYFVGLYTKDLVNSASFLGVDRFNYGFVEERSYIKIGSDFISLDTWGGYTTNFYMIRVGYEKYRVTFIDFDDSVLKVETVQHGDSATAPAVLIREDHEFTGWDIDYTNVTKDLVVTAQYERLKFNVKFEDFDKTELKTEVVTRGLDASAPKDPTREGYEFIGWDIDFINVTKDLIVTAQYKKLRYNVKFEDYDRTELKTEVVDHGSDATAPKDPTRKGFVFNDWDTDFTNVIKDLYVKATYKPIEKEPEKPVESKPEVKPLDKPKVPPTGVNSQIGLYTGTTILGLLSVLKLKRKRKIS